MWLVKVEVPGARFLLVSPTPFLSYGASYACISYFSLVSHRNPDGGRHCHTGSEKIQEGASVRLCFHVELCKGKGQGFFTRVRKGSRNIQGSQIRPYVGGLMTDLLADLEP